MMVIFFIIAGFLDFACHQVFRNNITFWKWDILPTFSQRVGRQKASWVNEKGLQLISITPGKKAVEDRYPDQYSGKN
jgi:hypothetical protein